MRYLVKLGHASVAQWIEHFASDEGVAGSTPARRANMDWFVYILESKDKTLYTGITNNLEKRISMHNAGKGSKSLLGKLPVKLVYFESMKDRSSASKRESEIKKLKRVDKLELITHTLVRQLD